MKIHLFQIPDEGLRRRVAVPCATLKRLVEACGAQTGELVGEVALRERGGNVELTGELTGALDVPCHRCLEPVPFAVAEHLSLTLVPPEKQGDLAEELTLSASDLDITFLDSEEIDLTAVLEEEALLAIPETVADEDDEGRCSYCGEMIPDTFGPQDPDMESHPFAPLKELLK